MKSPLCPFYGASVQYRGMLFSAMEDVQCLGGCSVPRKMFSTVGEQQINSEIGRIIVVTVTINQIRMEPVIMPSLLFRQCSLQGLLSPSMSYLLLFRILALGLSSEEINLNC